MGTGNNSATFNNMKLVHWPLTGRLLYLVRTARRGLSSIPPSPLLTVPNVTVHPSTASVPITVLLYNRPLLCGFNVPVKGLTESSIKHGLWYSLCDTSNIVRCIIRRLQPAATNSLWTTYDTAVEVALEWGTWWGATHAPFLDYLMTEEHGRCQSETSGQAAVNRH